MVCKHFITNVTCPCCTFSLTGVHDGPLRAVTHLVLVAFVVSVLPLVVLVGLCHLVVVVGGGVAAGERGGADPGAGAGGGRGEGLPHLLLHHGAGQLLDIIVLGLLGQRGPRSLDGGLGEGGVAGTGRLWLF